jgi:hypothetical protein
MPISRRVLLTRAVEHAEALPGSPTVKVYKSEVPDKPPVIVVDGEPDPGGRVTPYVVIYVLGGTPNIEPDLGGANDDLATGLQITVAAGYAEDAAHTVDRVHAHFYRWSPDLGDGVMVGRLEPPPGYDPGAVRPDPQPKPPRFYLPLLYTLIANT